ncbi:MAG: ATP:cob(I)alamin adenosyltransferase, partial [Acidimicrobiia bacterium]
MTIYTRKGDDGTTGLLYGGRVRKDADGPMAYGAVDEAQAAIGLARAEAPRGGRLDEILVGVCHDLYVCMAELATLEENRPKLVAGRTLATAEMVTAL